MTDFRDRRGPLIATVLGGLALALVALAVWPLFLGSPPPAEPSPSPTDSAASPSPAPGSPSPEPTTSPEPTRSPEPTHSPEPTLSPVPTESPTLAPSPEATPTASPQTGWLEITDFPTYRGTTSVESITTGGPGFVAVGDGGRNLRGRVWTSPDGLRWTAQPDSQFAGSALRKVVRLGSTLFVFGSGLEGPQVWRSSDARSWQALPHSPEFLYAGINDVAVVGQTMLAVGYVDDPDGDFTGAAWRSNDGIAWRRVSAPAVGREAWALAAQGTIVVAIDRFSPLHGGPPIYYSTDLGDSWQAAQTDLPTGEDAATGLVSVAANDQRFVAVGYGDTLEYPPIAARSADGRSWTSVTPPGGDLLSQVVTLADGRFLAFGRSPLLSADGSSWTELAHYTDQRPPMPPEGGDEVVTARALAASDAGVVVIQQWGNGIRAWFAPAGFFE